MLLACTLLVLGCLPGKAPAASADRWQTLVQTVFQNYGREQGLPPAAPTSLAQDGDGFLWIGTQSGLVRWDGYRYREYDATAPGGAHGLPDGWVRVLHADGTGRLWVGTDGDGLASYDRDKDAFTPRPLGPADRGSRHIGAICDDGTGGVWAGSDDGLFRIRSGGAPVAHFHHDERDSLSLPGDAVGALLLDHEGRLWVGSDRGLARMDPGRRGFLRIALTGVSDDSARVSALLEDGEGRVWIGTTQHGLYVIAPGGGVAEPFDGRDPNGWTLENERISAIAAAGDHEIWVSLRGNGIAAIDMASHEVRRIRHDPLVSTSLAHDDIWTLLRDRAGSIWVGSMGGLSYHPRDPGIVETVFGDTNQARGITGPDVSSVLSARDGRIWLGFLTGGVDIVDPYIGRVARIRPDAIRPISALPQDVVTVLAQRDNGDVFAATPRGVYRIDQGGRQATLFQAAGLNPHAIVRALLVDGPTLWIGGPEGLSSTPIGKGAPPARGPSAFRGLSDQSVFALLRGRKHDLWIGTANGLDRLDLASGAVEQSLADPAVKSALPGRLVSSLLEDRQGRLWVGTFGGGIAVMTGEDRAGRPLFRRIGAADGLPNLNIDNLLLDGSGIVWASTDDGLAAIDPATFHVRAIQRGAGAVLTAFWVNSGATDRWGEPLFGAKGGMAVVRPGWPADWSPKPPVVVSDIRIGGVAVAGGRFNGAGSDDPLVVSPTANSLTVEFSALDFTEPQRNRYAYRLDGFDRDWIETDATRRLATYTNLPPGHYVLRLVGSNRAGVWSKPELRIPIHVLAAWYQTLWIRFLALIVIGMVVFAITTLVVRLRTAGLSRRQAELEAEVTKRTAELRDANDRLSELVKTDPLTGCANRRRFMERAVELVELGRRGVPMSLAIMDIDNFKLINDRYGHPVGDDVLEMAGRTSRATIRATDLIGRIGGEEFAVLMPNTGAAEALVIVDRLRAALAEAELRVGTLSVRSTVSLGLAEQQEGEDFDSLYARADAALYAAKANGRDRVVVAPETRSPSLVV
jgi:diguanylate cyclase (GGDEF)-like protein